MIEDELILGWIDRIDTELVRFFGKKDLSCNPLDRAMEYTLLAGGKRLRPLMTLVVYAEFGGDVERVLPFSLAAEFLHTYSLIHDDLPCMDDDDMRRGKPTNHLIFGEAHSILAGDALQTEAFHVLAATPLEGLAPERRNRIVSEFCEAVGRKGMVAGQVMDLEQEGKPIDLERLKLLHCRKTGVLFRFCVRLGGHLARVGDEDMKHLSDYADAVGLLFQVVDDLLDEEAGSETLGKTAGKDAHKNKATFPRLMGAAETHQFADRLLQDALSSLGFLRVQGKHLRILAEYVRRRSH